VVLPYSSAVELGNLSVETFSKAATKRPAGDSAVEWARDFIVGLVRYTGGLTLPFGPRLRAMPISALWQVGSCGCAP
jgi:hypothetical protein